MKKITGKIALILIIIMLAGSFTGCFTTWAVKEGGEAVWLVIFPILPALDLITSPIQLTIYLIEISEYSKLQKKNLQMDKIDTFSANISYIPDDELLYLKDKLSALPDNEIKPFTDTIDAFSEREIIALTRAFNDLTEDEVVFSIETLNSMPDEMLIAALNNLKNVKFMNLD